MLGTLLIAGDERQVDLALVDVGEVDASPLSGFLEPIQRQTVSSEVDLEITMEPVEQTLGDELVEILPSETISPCR